MKNDERITGIKNEVESIGYWLLWGAIFLVLLYRWWFAGQTIIDTIDIFSVWLVTSLIVGGLQARRGVPVVSEAGFSNKSYILLPAIAAGALSFFIALFRGGITSLIDAVRIIGLPFLIVCVVLTAVYFVWKKLYIFWYEENFDGE